MTKRATPIARPGLLVAAGAMLAVAIGGRLAVEATLADELEPPKEAIDVPEQPEPREDGFQRTRRPGAVQVAKVYDVANATIPLDEVHELLPRDAIPALTDPKLERVSEAEWLPTIERVIEVVVNGEAVAAPLMILNYHEIANMTIGGEPVAITYCPLCDSASVVSRRVEPADGSAPVTLAFGVSGALYNSNVLMYDQRDLGLWSQVAMEAVSGPLVGTKLKHYPVRVVSASDFKLRHPGGKVLSMDTGHTRVYAQSAYDHYLLSDRIIVDVHNMGDALPKKTLGLGIKSGDKTWFVSIDAIGADGRAIDTPAGRVEVSSSERAIQVDAAPAGVQTMQTFYYSWSAFHPDTEIIK